MTSPFSRSFKSWFRNWTKDPDTEEPELAEQRRRQWRRYSRDPFEAVDEPKKRVMPSGPTLNQAYAGNIVDGIEEIPYGKPLPTVFYDLAWTASFASLTQNGTFDTPMDYVSYCFFFAAVMWLWASQTLYSIHFYTNDWFHLLCTFFHLCVFGMIAATTVGTGYDIGNYISHSPGTDELDPKPIEDINDPKRYFGEITASLSATILALAFVITRIVHLAQHMRVVYYLYARWSTLTVAKRNDVSRSTRQFEAKIQDRKGDTSKPGLHDPEAHWIAAIPPHLKAITAGLLVSNPMFLAALGIATSEFDKTVAGASLRLGLWIGGFLVEVISHLIVPYHYWTHSRSPDDPNEHQLGPHVGYNGNLGLPSWYRFPETPEMGLYTRLQTVTTIILGEGINSIAGTFTFFLRAPNLVQALRVLVPCTALIIWFIAYTYFEGPKGKKAPRTTSLRYMFWLILHLPFLSSTVLLLVGIKSQFFLVSFLLSLLRTASGFSQILVEQLQGNPNITYWRNNVVMKHFILERGLVWEDEFNNFLDTLSNATGAEKSMVMPAWTQRLTLTLALKSFKDFNGGEDSIPGDLLPVITSYYENLTQVIKDLEVMPENPEEAAFYQIVDGLISGSVLSTRCIIGFAGLILISLSLQDFIHSWPRDRYQWGVITSRFVMGIVLCLLLLLNIGRYQELVVPNDKLNQRAGVFQWLEAFWVLPTIAIAYGVQFLVEIILARFAKKALKRAEASEKPEEIND